MIVDFREFDGDAIRADICIVGAGAVGIAMAREFAGTQHQVAVLESGGLDIDVDTQFLYIGENVGLPYFELEGCRLRYFGGTINHWSGWCVPLGALDFEKRDWVPRSGWGLSRDELLPFYRRAQPIFGVGPFENYEAGTWQKLGVEPIPLDANKLVTMFSQQLQPPLNFGRAYRAEIERASNVTVYLNANVTRVQLSDSGQQAARLEVAALAGKRSIAEAKFVVLACGGLENARLLLNSDDVQRGGVGNDHDQVGRYFMEHPEIVGAEIFESTDNAFAWKFDWFRELDVRAVVCPSPQLQKEAGILNLSAHLRAVYERSAGLSAARDIVEAGRQLEVPDDFGGKLWDVVSDLDDIAAAGWSWIEVGNHSRYRNVSSFPVEIHCEQAPNPDSRVFLSEQKDALGLRQIKLDWRLTELERRTIETVLETMAAEFARLGLARMRQSDWLASGEGWTTSEVVGGYHHMGTTRMSDDPKHGVVDPNCKVHGVENLYIAGSSTFPTSGWANPTLTIVALALRLSDHLKQRLGSYSASSG